MLMLLYILYFSKKNPLLLYLVVSLGGFYYINNQDDIINLSRLRSGGKPGKANEYEVAKGRPASII